MDTLSGIESTNIISHMARRSIARVVLGSLDFFQPMEYLSITASTASIFSNTAFAREEAKADSENTSASAAYEIMSSIEVSILNSFSKISTNACSRSSVLVIACPLPII